MSGYDETLAASLTASDTRLIPFLPYLLQDIFELGSDSREIAGLLALHACPDESSRIIDLGCGKGAVSLEIASRFSCRVEGRDLMEAFIAEAKARAEASNLSSLCNFVVEDLRRSVQTERGYDVAIYGAVGPVFGDQRRCLSSLRPVVRSGGYLVIDDAWGPEGSGYPTLAQWRDLFGTTGYAVVAEVPVDSGWLQSENERNQACIEQRAQELCGAYPDLSDMFIRYVEDQRAECEELANTIVGVTWLLQVR
ncbi:MAG: class I SAM-dependent methyltransferase [Sphaerochaetaceae bacterium]|nr:class I SAM-dependent methyltransferase [Sphaerochaetaceae bacterium]